MCRLKPSSSRTTPTITVTVQPLNQLVKALSSMMIMVASRKALAAVGMAKRSRSPSAPSARKLSTITTSKMEPLMWFCQITCRNSCRS